MVPAGAITERTVSDLASRLDAGDVIIDGGNSYYRDDIRRASEVGAKGVHYVDVGTSGGVFGLQRGFCLMIGAEDDVVRAPRADLPHPRARASRPPSGRPAGPVNRRWPSGGTSIADRTAPATS